MDSKQTIQIIRYFDYVCTKSYANGQIAFQFLFLEAISWKSQKYTLKSVEIQSKTEKSQFLY